MEMSPGKDQNPAHFRPIVTIVLIVSCGAVFLWLLWLASLSGDEVRRAVVTLGSIPAVAFRRDNLPPEIAILPPAHYFLALVSHMFLHSGWGHVLWNMCYLGILGGKVEGAMGHLRFLLFYLICGIVAGLAHAASDPASIMPVVGASGAISGVAGAYLLLYPRTKVPVPAPWAPMFLSWQFLVPGFVVVTIRYPFLLFFQLPAVLVLVIWFLMQIAFAAAGVEGAIAWWAHIGGFVAGMLLVPLFKHRHVGLWSRIR